MQRKKKGVSDTLLHACAGNIIQRKGLATRDKNDQSVFYCDKSLNPVRDIKGVLKNGKRITRK